MSERRKHIALFMGQPDEEFQHGFLQGFIEETDRQELDVWVFSMLTEYQNSTSRERGEASVYEAANLDFFDAVVVLADTIQTEGVLERLTARIRDEYKGPVLYVDGEGETYPVVWADCYSPMKALVTYLVEECGYRKFAYLNGKKWNRHAQTRLRAFRDALTEHGVEIDESRIYDGDFWYSSGISCVRQLLSDSRGLPEVIVCANDVMAIGLCDELDKNGIQIPEQLSVAGFDSTFEGRTSPKAVTSAGLDARGCGMHTVGELLHLMAGEPVEDHIDVAPSIFYGETVRHPKTPDTEGFTNRRWCWATYESRMSYLSVHTTYDDDLLIPETMEEFLQAVWSHLMRFGGIEDFQLILNSTWDQPGMFPAIGSAGRPFSERMVCALHFNPDAQEETGIGRRNEFPQKEMLPFVEGRGKDAPVRFFLPLYFDERCFGYTAIVFHRGNVGYDKEIRLYVYALSRALEVMRRNQERLNLAATGEYNAAGTAMEKKSRRNLSRDEKKEYKETMKILDHNLFRYFFQPIVDAETGEIYSYEALMRADSALPISPLNLLRYAQMEGRLYDIERDTLLNVLSIIGKEEVFQDKKVFINSIPGVLLDDDDRSKVEALIKKCAENVVIEVTEQAEMGDHELDDLKERYRSLGTQIAIDDYGTGYSNAGNLLRYMPDIVKIDRALLADIEKSQQKQHFVREIIDFCHDNGMKALAEGVETAEELRTVIRFGADLIQGYYTGRPAPDPIEQINDNVRSEILRYQQEKQDGSNQSVYVAGKSGRVLMGSLIKEGISHIVIGQDRMTYRDIAFAGAPGQRSNIHIRIERGYEGVLTLENVSLSNVKGRPCIEINEGCNVILILTGDNTLSGNGIYVSEGSNLRLEGNGNLEIRINSNEYFGIGAGIEERHGQLTFSQDGNIRINANGNGGVGIGSGKGGGIEINRGSYSFSLSGQNCVAIGSYTGYEHFLIQDSECVIDMSTTDGVCLGSLRGSSDVRVERAAVRIYAAAKRLVAIGTLSGASGQFRLTDGNLDVETQVDAGTCIGSLAGASEFSVTRAGVKLDNRGSRSLLIGGYDERTRVSGEMANIRGEVWSEEKRWTYAGSSNIQIKDSRMRFEVNGYVVYPEREEEPAAAVD
ncbi:MAG: EAL domain-containing protein [Lachnospiraceae bacterium]|nr:EAL domain-containing protein [Lachnospiraceae bacterium]